MTIFGVDAGTFAAVAGLMAVCGGAIGRLLWLLDGRPPLDRPSWWPGAARRTASVEGSAPPAPPAPSERRLAIAACAACCGVPLLVVAGVVSLGLATAFSVSAGLLVGAALLAGAALAGRLRRWRRSRTAPGPSCHHPSAVEAEPEW